MFPFGKIVLFVCLTLIVYNKDVESGLILNTARNVVGNVREALSPGKKEPVPEVKHNCHHGFLLNHHHHDCDHSEHEVTTEKPIQQSERPVLEPEKPITIDKGTQTDPVNEPEKPVKHDQSIDDPTSKSHSEAQKMPEENIDVRTGSISNDTEKATVGPDDGRHIIGAPDTCGPGMALDRNGRCRKIT